MPAGDYTVLRQLGKGSFGRVFLVRRVSDESLWVMKEIDLAASGDANKARADALKEVGMLSRLDHPNIVQYKECFQTSDPLTPPPAPSPTSPAAAAPSSSSPCPRHSLHLGPPPRRPPPPSCTSSWSTPTPAT